jgi:hypothetical protein
MLEHTSGIILKNAVVLNLNVIRALKRKSFDKPQSQKDE